MLPVEVLASNATDWPASIVVGVAVNAAVGAVYFAVRAAVVIFNDEPTAVYPKVFDPEVSRLFTLKESHLM